MAERTTIHKWFWVWDFEKEERWLNEMALRGQKLVDVGWCRFTFEPCEPGEYTIRLQLTDASNEYLAFMESTGAEYVGRMIKWVYFRKKTELGEFEIFSDIDSRISHLDRIGKMLALIGGANLLLGVANSMNASHFGWINLLCATLLMYALGRIHGKKEELEKDRVLHE